MKKLIILFFGLFFISCILDAQTWYQIGQEINGQEEGEYFGNDLCLSSNGSIVAISAYRNDQNGTDAGQVRIYENIEGIWTQVGESLSGENAGDAFGTSVSINSNGNIIAVGGMWNDDNGVDAGQVIVFENISGTWNQIGQNINGESAYDQFGCSVCLNSDGTILCVGAFLNDDNGTNAGSVRIYQNFEGSWVQIGQDIDGEAGQNYFGETVSINGTGTIIAVGAPRNFDNGTAAGHVRVFEFIDDEWVQIGQDIDGVVEWDEFGMSLSLSSDGNVFAAGSTYENGSLAGQVRTFYNDGGTWSQLGQDLNGNNNYDAFGRSVDLNNDGTILAAGATQNDDNGTNAGHVKVFEYFEGSWYQTGQNIEGQSEQDNFGSNLSLNSTGSILAIGATGNDENGLESGQVRVFHLAPADINNIKSNEVNVYPNPTKDFVNIEFLQQKLYLISIKDITGKLLITKNVEKQNVSFDLSNFAKGIYFINIQTDKEILTSKVIKR